MALTAKQEAFAQAIADGLNQSDAYRKAYEAKAMSDAATHVESCNLLKNPKVALRVADLKAKLEAKALWTREMSVTALSKIVLGSDKGSEIVAAVKELNAMHGYQAPTKMEASVNGNLSITKIELVPLK